MSFSGRLQRVFKNRKAIAVAVFGILLVVLVALVGDLRYLDDDVLELLALIVLGFIAGLGFIVWGFHKYWQKSLIENTPTSKIRSMALGLVEVFGRTVPHSEVLKSPFSGEDCIFYKYEVKEYKMQGKHRRWVTINEGREGVPFFVEDDTGRVMIDSAEADLNIPVDNKIRVGGGEEPPREIQEFIEKNKKVESENKKLDLKLFEVSTGNRRRYLEYFVTPGERVYVFGKAMERPGLSSSRNEENIVISKDETTPMFIISDSSEKELVSKMSKDVLLFVFGGGILSVGSFTALLWMFQLLGI